MSASMLSAAYALIAPVFLSVFILLLMMQIAFWRNARTSWWLTCTALFIAMVLCAQQLSQTSVSQITPLLISDRYSLVFTLLILFATLVTALLARDYLVRRAGENEEFYLLLLLSALGGILMVSATHLASFLLGLELLGVALYALIAYPERGHYPLEAAVKYLILSGAASAILLFGFALLYAAVGTLNFVEIGIQLGTPLASENKTLLLVATAFIFTGLGFKLSLVPFHMWTPDVYQGAPSPVAGFLATVSKTAIFAAMMRFFVAADLQQYAGLLTALTAIAIASMLVGNLLALQQQNLKRLLAYSSIAHLGYLLIVVIVLSTVEAQALAIEASVYYLIAYVLTSLGAFALLTVICSEQRESSTGDVESIQGLFWRQPVLATMFTIALLSFAGIPLTAGFIGKFYLFTLGIEGSLWWLVAALVIGSAIGIYYYLRLVFAMSQKPTDSPQAEMTVAQAWPAKLVAVSIIVLVLYFGILPQSVMSWLGGIVL